MCGVGCGSIPCADTARELCGQERVSTERELYELFAKTDEVHFSDLIISLRRATRIRKKCYCGLLIAASLENSLSQ